MTNNVTALGMTLFETTQDDIRFGDFFSSLSYCYGLEYDKSGSETTAMVSFLIRVLLEEEYLMPVLNDKEGWELYSKSKSLWMEKALHHLNGFASAPDWWEWDNEFWMSATEKTKIYLAILKKRDEWRHYLDSFNEKDYPLEAKVWSIEEASLREAKALEEAKVLLTESEG